MEKPQGMCFYFGKNAFSALRSLWVPKICVAAIGVCVFGALTSVGALFYFYRKKMLIMDILASLYQNIGEKIKRWAIVIFIVEAIASVIGAIVIMVSAEDYWILIVGLLALFLGPLVAWVSSWLVYGFGELLDTCSIVEYYARNSNETLNAIYEHIKADDTKE